MGLFNHHQRQSSSSTSMDPHPHPSIHTPSRSSTSSARSVHSAHSTATLKADGLRSAASTARLAYAVGSQAEHQHAGLYEHSDVVMTDGDVFPSMYAYHAPSGSSRHPPVPPARTTSLAHPGGAGSLTTSASLPTVSLTHATPTKKSSAKRQEDNHPYPALSHSPTQSRGATLGLGSLDVSEDTLIASDGRANLAYTGRRPGPLADSRLANDDDSEEEQQRARRAYQEQSKKERAREQGRKRQARKRERDKKAKEDAKAKLTVNIGADKSQHSAYPSRNASTASLAPLSTPNLSATTPPFGPSTSTSSFHSLMPTSASYTSLSLNASPFSGPSQHISGTSSPITPFSPIISTSGSATIFDQQLSSYPAKTYASRSAVDVRLSSAFEPQKPKQGVSRGSTTSLSMTLDQPVYPVPLAPAISPSGQSHAAKRRRSEPEPELFKKGAEVGLGVMGISEHAHEHEAVEYLDSPVKPSRSSGDHLTIKERPGIRRTASDSAAVSLDLSHPQTDNRSPTPPLLPSLKRGYSTLADPDATPVPTKEGEWFAETVATAMSCSEHSAVQATMSRLNINLDDLKAMSADLAACFDRHKQAKLVKKMKEVSLDDNVRQGHDGSTLTSVTTTPLRGSATLSTTSTSSSSPTASRVELSHALPASLPTEPMLSIGTSRPGTMAREPPATHTTPKMSGAPNRARSLSSASMRARGFKLGPKTTAKSPTLIRPQQSPLVSPMSTTSFQFPNTPSIHHVPESDGASPMPSSVQTPNTAQSAYFNHDDIDAAMNASQGGFGGMGGHHRSATDPMGSKTYTTRQQHSISGYPSSNAEPPGSWNNHASASSSGLSSPVDMPSHYRHHSYSSSLGQIPAFSVPPPHQYPFVQSSSHHQQQPDSSLPFQVQMPTPSSQPVNRHQTQSHPTSAGAPFTPSSQGQVHRPSHSGMHAWQPNLPPTVEQGTPTRPSSHQATPIMMDHDANANRSSFFGARQGEMDQRVLSPNPPTVPVPFPLEGHWTDYQVPQQSGEMGQIGLADPFMASYQGHPPPST